MGDMTELAKTGSKPLLIFFSARIKTEKTRLTMLEYSRQRASTDL